VTTTFELRKRDGDQNCMYHLPKLKWVILSLLKGHNENLLTFDSEDGFTRIDYLTDNATKTKT